MAWEVRGDTGRISTHATKAKAQAAARRLGGARGRYEVVSSRDSETRGYTNPRRKRRTPAQIRATKKLVAMNRARAPKRHNAGRKRKACANPEGRAPKTFMKCKAVRVVTRGGKKILEVKR
jgi:hypothetical protein